MSIELDDTQEFQPVPDVVNDPKARRLRALAGTAPYIFIVAGTDGTDVDFSGITPDDLPGVLQELIDALVAD